MSTIIKLPGVGLRRCMTRPRVVCEGVPVGCPGLQLDNHVLVVCINTTRCLLFIFTILVTFQLTFSFILQLCVAFWEREKVHQ